MARYDRRPLHMIGFWSEGVFSPYPHPRYLIDERNEISKLDRLAMVKYLRSGYTVSSYMGHASCRFKNGPTAMGCRDLTDGRWLWPEGLAIYVDKYNIKLPIEFISFAKSNNFKFIRGPDEFTGAVANRHTISNLKWILWTMRHSRFSVFQLPFYLFSATALISCKRESARMLKTLKSLRQKM